MCEEIFSNLFRIKIPLPESPLKYLNSYVIRDAQRNLIIDTGLNHTQCFDAMQAGIKKIGIDLARTDFFITHLHADHFGLVGRLATPSSDVFFSRLEKELVESWEGFDEMINYAGQNGFPKDELRAALGKHPGARYGSDWIPELKVLEDGNVIDIGDYHFRCVATPGHTMGHTCLYEADKKILVAGDHILIDITPNIQCWGDDQNPLKFYLASLDKVYRLSVALTLPGHRRLIEDHRARIDELKQHHSNRLSEVLALLEDGPLSAFQVAARMTWDIAYDSWEQFPVAQRWFATGEALSHLRYLEEEGRLTRFHDNEITLYERLK